MTCEVVTTQHQSSTSPQQNHVSSPILILNLAALHFDIVPAHPTADGMPVKMGHGLRVNAVQSEETHPGGAPDTALATNTLIFSSS
jgi:hypothetical protein